MDSNHNARPTYVELQSLASIFDELAAKARREAALARLNGYPYPPGWWLGVHAGMEAAAAELRTLVSTKLEADQA
jgi:hypothetical protein